MTQKKLCNAYINHFTGRDAKYYVLLTGGAQLLFRSTVLLIAVGVINLSYWAAYPHYTAEQLAPTSPRP